MVELLCRGMFLIFTYIVAFINNSFAFYCSVVFVGPWFISPFSWTMPRFFSYNEQKCYENFCTSLFRNICFHFGTYHKVKLLGHKAGICLVLFWKLSKLFPKGFSFYIIPICMRSNVCIIVNILGCQSFRLFWWLLRGVLLCFNLHFSDYWWCWLHVCGLVGHV